MFYVSRAYSSINDHLIGIYLSLLFVTGDIELFEMILVNFNLPNEPGHPGGRHNDISLLDSLCQMVWLSEAMTNGRGQVEATLGTIG